MVDFLDDGNDRQEEVTPSLAEVLKVMQASTLENFHAFMVCKIVTYDFKKQSASVQPLLKRTFSDGTTDKPPILNDVPNALQRGSGGDSFIHVPYQPGDLVLVGFMDSSLDTWKSSGAETAVSDPRSHDISDGVIITGLWGFNKRASLNNGDDLILKNKNSEIRMVKSGQFQFLNNGVDLLKAIDDFFCSGNF
jgi:hypothetical protein